MFSTVRASARRSGSRRGFTLLEVGVAAAMFMTVLGVVAVASARAQYAAQSARSLSALAAEAEFLLDRLEPGDVSVYGLSEVPSPCPEDAFRSCLTVFGRPAFVSWSVERGGSWTGDDGGEDSGPSLTVVATATGDRGVQVVRSRELRLPSPRRLVRLVAAGQVGYEGPVFLHAVSGDPLVWDDGGTPLPVGAVVGPSGAVLLEVPEGRCLVAGECVVALAPDGGSSSGAVALSPESASASVLVSEEGVSEHVFEVARELPVSVLLEALLPSGERAYPTVPGSVCLHLAVDGRSGWEEAAVACNVEDPRMVTFTALEAGGRTAALPEGVRVRVAAAPVAIGAACTAESGRMVPSAAGWSPAPEGQDLPCSQDLWGVPSGFRTSPDAPASEGVLTFVPDGGLPSLVWAADPPSFTPVEASGGSVSEYSQGGTTYRVHTFASVGTSQFVVSDAGTDGQVDLLVVGGGGGGGASAGAAASGGGGGAGGVLSGSAVVVAGSYSIVVGGGGSGGAAGTDQRGSSGGSSSAFTVTAFGGGGGGGRQAGGQQALDGGSGGGGGSQVGLGGAGTVGQGNDGGDGNSPTLGGGGDDTGGGGGGAGGAGSDAISVSGASPSFPGGGGAGTSSSISGSETLYGGGGGGGVSTHVSSTQTRAEGGSGGGAGGVGNGSATVSAAESGLDGRGGGGGGAGGTRHPGGAGGSGAVIIRYRAAQVTGDEVVVPAAGTVGGIRVDAPWSAPLSCSFPCTDPSDPVTPPVPFLEGPALGMFGVPGVTATPGSSVEVTVRPRSRSGPVPLTLGWASDGVSFEYRDDTLRDAYDLDPDPEGEPPPVWFALTVGGSVPSSAYTPSGQVRLRATAASGAADHAARWNLDGGAVTALMSLPAGGDAAVDLLVPALRLPQGSSSEFSATAVSASGEVLPLPPGSLAGGDAEGVLVTAPDAGGTVLIDVYAAAAGGVTLATGLPTTDAPIDLPVTIIPRPGPLEVTADLPGQMLQGTSSQVTVTVRDLAGAPLPGWPVWVRADDLSGTFVRGIRSRQVACATSTQGSCLLEVAFGRTLPEGPVRTTVVAGWASTVSSSPARTVTVAANPSGVAVDGAVTSPGGTVSSRALVRTAAQEPVPGTVLQVSQQVTLTPPGSSPSQVASGSVAQVSSLGDCPDVLLCVAVSGPSDASGAVFLDLEVAGDAQTGVYGFTISTASGLSSPWLVTVAPLTAAAELASGVFAAPGGSVLLPVTLREPSGAPARAGRVVVASSPVEGVRAEVVGVSGPDGLVLLTVTLDTSAAPPDGLLEVFLVVDGQALASPLSLPTRDAVAQVVVEGAAVRAAVSSQLRLRLLDAAGDAVGAREASAVFPSWLTVSPDDSDCGEGLFCFDADSELLLEVSAPLDAPSTGTIGLTVDGVALSVPFLVVD